MAFDNQRAIRIATDPIAEARQVKERTGKCIVGTISSWAPDPVILASGALPVRLPAPGGDAAVGNRARAHLQAASCFLSQGILEDGLQGRLDFMDALLFVQTCDAQQNLSDILKMAVPSLPVVDLYMPVNRSSRAAVSYLVDELARVMEELGEITNTRGSEQDLERELEVRQGVENALADLYDARAESASLVPAMEHYAACVASSCLPPAESEPMIRDLVAQIRQGRSTEEGTSDSSCMMLGSVIPYPGLYRLFDMLGIAIRDDDLSLGRRLFDHPVPAQGPPLERIARSMLDRSPGATKYDDGLIRGMGLVRAARRLGVKHVVMPVLKFCDPWAWDYPAVRDRLDEAGIGMLLLELAGGEDLSAGPIRNRVEAYFEMDTVGDLFDG